MVREKCPRCSHLRENHWRTRGCGTPGCACREDPPPPAPAPAVALGTRELQQLLVMATHGQRAVAAAALLVETFPALVLQDQRAHADVAAGVAALADMLNALRSLLEFGRMPDPVRRWTLGVPETALDPPPRRWTA